MILSVKGDLSMVRIVTDSAADFEPDELEKLGVVCIPLTVSFGNSQYKENKNLSKDMFYNLLYVQKQIPYTSQPSPYEFEDVFRKFQQAGDDTVAILISSNMSGTYQGAESIKKICEYENCYIVDSLNASAGERLLVEYAVKLRDEGKSAVEIYNALQKIKTKLRIYACLDTVEYLYRGGRISRTAAGIASVAHIKPVITIKDDGSVAMCHKLLGMKRGIQYMLKIAENDKVNFMFPMYIIYSHFRSNADELVQQLEKAGYHIPESRIVNVGSVIGSHIGTNACGLVYVSQK